MNKLELAVRGGRIVTDAGLVQADLYVTSGKVVGMGRLDVEADETVDAGGLVVLPGMIDAHVHFMDPADTSREDFPTGSRAAAAAGVTTVVEHAHGRPVYTANDLRQKAGYLADRSVVDFGLGAHFSPKGVEEIEGVWRAGATFIKVFTCTTHGIEAVKSGPLLRAMQKLSEAGAVFLVHAEDESLTETAEAELRAEGRADGGVVPQWRNLLAEQVSVASVGRLAAHSGATVVVAHCSHPSVVDLVASVRKQGASIYAESCPQYLFLYEEEVEEAGAFRKFTPPARARSVHDLDDMWERLNDGRITYVSTDHAPSTREQKADGSIWDVHFGLPGIDTTFPLMLDAALRGKISLERVVEMYSTVPAKTYGMSPQKGGLHVGGDADFVLIDPSGKRTLSDDDVISKAGWTPFAGRELLGTNVATYLRGRKIAEGRRCVAEPGYGRFLPGKGAKAAS